MKKIIWIVSLLLLLSGCGKVTTKNVVSDLTKKIESAKTYQLKGELTLYGDEDTFTYEVVTTYEKEDKYLVTLKNEITGHEQNILKNEEGTYVVTPSLNKSYKFQSDWPKNSSQAFILECILSDLEKRETPNVEETEDYFVIETDVEYPNNSTLKIEKLYVDKDLNLKLVEVYDESNNLKIKLTIAEIKYNLEVEENTFTLETAATGEKEEQTSALEEILYPLYVPSNTYLKDKETIATEEGQRTILTFSGSKDFVLVEETSTVNDDLEIIPIHGNPVMMNGTIGALSGNSIYWSENNRDYYLAGNTLTEDEILAVANSISNTLVTGK